MLPGDARADEQVILRADVIALPGALADQRSGHARTSEESRI